MSALRGYSNLSMIKRSIAHLYASFGSKHIQSFTNDFFSSIGNPRYSGDVNIATQRLAADIASHYRLPITTVIVNYSTTLQPPGRVELSNGNEFFIELQSKYRGKLNTVAGILAHEIAHIFLHRCGAEWKDTNANEILTDTTASFLGFGIAIMNAADCHTEYLANATKTISQYFGYLSLDEFGYILARRDHAFNLSSRAQIGQHQCKDAYDTGFKKYMGELKTRPFTPRPWYQRLLCRTPIKPDNALQSPILFECPRCSKTLRLPEMRKKVSVHCPICDSRFFCYS